MTRNEHMEHLEDLVLNQGVVGARHAINFLQSLRNALVGRAKEEINTTVKWDGSPAIFVGKDPEDGKFFVAKKSIFNKEPKVYKNNNEIDADTEGDLNTKLKTALYYLKDLNIEGVLQGDFLFTKDDLKIEKIEGTRYITFHPNTIVYAVPYDSDLGEQIRNSAMGVVWHTKYSGSELSSLSASYQVSVNDLNQLPGVWQVDANYKDLSGSATMTEKESKDVSLHLSLAGGAFRRIDVRLLNTISTDKNLLEFIKIHHNLHIRSGREITSPMLYVRSLYKFLEDRVKKDINMLKTERGQENKRRAYKAVFDFLKTPQYRVVPIFELQMHLVHAKKLIIQKMNKASKLDTFLKTNNGFKITGHEGYVAVDNIKGAVKLVDRLEFSYSNFSPDIVKGFENERRT